MNRLHLIYILLLALLLSPVVGDAQAQPSPPSLPVAQPAVENDLPEELSGVPGVTADWWAAVQENIARSEYRITWQERTYLDGVEAAYQAPNRAHNLRTYFTPDGVRVIPRFFDDETPPWEWGLTLTGYGYASTMLSTGADAVQSVGAAVLAADDNSIAYQYPNSPLAGWYVNDERGLEQGFTLHEPPPGTGAEIVLELALDGDLTPHLTPDGEAVEFTTPLGVRVLRYGELRVHDATGRALPARLSLSPGGEGRGEGSIRIVLDPTDAVYPITVDPLATTPGWAVESDKAEAKLGYSVATAGDVNGDGFADIIVGAPEYNGSAGGNTGRAYVYYGSPAGPSVAEAWIVEGDQEWAVLGYSVGTAGDVNGDGYDDVIIGAVMYSNGEQYEGRAYVYYGSPSGLAATPAWSAESDQADAQFGYSVGTAGDVNGDGYDDVIIGAPKYDNGQNDEGRVYVYHGSAGGLSTTPDWTAEGNQADAQFGYSVGTAGDVNNDGYDDVIIGAYGNFATTYRACVYHGSAGGLSTTPDWSVETSNQTGLGRAVGTAGDVNGDGYDDVIVGEYYNTTVGEAGRANLYAGSSAGLPITATWTITGDIAHDYFGDAVGTAGDVNGDGYDDVIIGAPEPDDDASHEAQAYIYYGSASGPSTTPDWAAGDDQRYSYFGYSVGTAGDVNGDGQVEVIVGVPYYNHDESNEGRAFIYHLPVEGTPHPFADWMVEGNQDRAWLGDSLSTAGDVNDDGYADVIVGVPHYSNGYDTQGAVFGFYGSAAGLPITATWTVEGNQFANLGQAVGAAGDVNGDGYDDVIIGQDYPEAVFVYYGSAGGLPITATQTISGPTQDENFGQSVGTAGDVNGDGYDDVIIGAPRHGSSKGWAYVYHGSATGLSTTPAWTAAGEAEWDSFGSSVGTAGDVNGDGYDDVIVGACFYNLSAGRAYVYHGSASGLSSTAAWTAEGDQTYALFGYSVGTAGDVNGDGYSDVIVGAPHYGDGYADEGAAYVYHGSASGLSSTAAWSVESDQADAKLGDSVGTAGDVNGDGYDEVIVGASRYGPGDYAGAVFLYTGSAAGLSPTAAWSAESDQGGLGNAVGTAGDVNGDGYSDLIAGARFYDNGETNEGAAFLFYGSATGPRNPPNWSEEGEQANAYLGAAVSSAGDVDGDGYSDILVGAPWYDDGEADVGAAFLYPGGPAGPPITATWVVTGSLAGARLGYALGLAGDVDGDGYTDVIIGAPGYDGAGAAFLYPGSAAGPPITATWVVTGGQDGADFGFAVGTAGDVDGDGYSDVLIGAPWYDDKGAIFIYPGSPSGLPLTTTWAFEADQDHAQLGYAVGTAGDVDGDGFADIIAGAPAYDAGQTNEGRAYLYRGSASGPLAAAWTVEGNQEYAYLGRALGTAGDVDGDGYSDVIVGVPAYDGSYLGEGQARLYLGSAGGLSTTPDWTVEGGHVGYGLGDAVGTAGDVDGDGYADVLIGVPYYDNGEADEGQVRLYHGSPTGLGSSPDWVGEGNGEYAHFGRVLGTAGDVNGDGYSDILIGIPGYGGYDNPMHLGGAIVRYGSPDNLASSADWTAEGEQGGAWFGYSVGTAGDVNGDGYADVIVGAPHYDDGYADEGRVFVYHGSAAGLATTPDWSAAGDQGEAEFGWAVRTAGDVDNDGYSDVVIGARRYDDGQTDEGAAFVYHGSAAGLGTTPAWTAEGNQDEAWFGFSVGTAGDVNGDGYADLIVGAQYYDGDQTNEGRVYIYHGAAGGLSTVPDWIAEGDQEDERFGYAVGTAGDVDGDGYSDVVVGAPYYDGGGADEGKAFVYHGSAAGLATTPGWSAEGDQDGAEFGRAVGRAGDVNGDGYADLIVGAPGYDHGHTDEGRVFVYNGGAAGLSAAPTWIGEGHHTAAALGISVGTAGDVDGDGYADIIVGAHGYGDGEANEGRVYLYRGSWFGPTLIGHWSAESDRADAYLGFSVGTAGDVNGDGYSDVIVGAYGYDNVKSNEGAAFLYYGGGDGWSLRPRQLRSDGASVIPCLGTSDSRTTFLIGLVSRMPLGRQEVCLQWQAAPLGTLITATDVISGVSEWTDALTGGVEITQTVAGLTMATGYRWRARFLYRPGNALGQVSGPWVHIPWGGWNETTLRTAFNIPPAANAGADQTAATSAMVTLDGSGSNDPDGDYPLSYLWSQTGGPPVTLSDPTVVGPTFAAPSEPTVLTFTLVVTDSLGLPDPTPDEVVITVGWHRIYLPLVVQQGP